MAGQAAVSFFFWDLSGSGKITLSGRYLPVLWFAVGSSDIGRVEKQKQSSEDTFHDVSHNICRQNHPVTGRKLWKTPLATDVTGGV